MVLDTVRKDAIDLYSGEANTPFIDDFATDSVVFRDCVSPAPWTIPAHASIFTGLYPSAHNIHVTRESKCLSLIKSMNYQSAEVFPETLKRKGYETFGFSANYFLRPGSGFERGFDKFQYTDVRGMDDEEREIIEEELTKLNGDRRQLSLELLGRGEISKLAKLYLTYRRIRRRQESLNYPASKGGSTLLKNIRSEDLSEYPFFLFANFMESHEPYVDYELRHWSSTLEDLFGIRKIPLSVLGEIKQTYHAATGQLDSLFGELIRNLKERSLYDDSLIIVTSDHGQEFREHGYYGHGLFLHDEIIQVPLIVKFPVNRRFRTENGYQSLVDIPSLIRNAIEGPVTRDLLTRDTVFSECYGMHQQFIPKGRWRDEYDVPRKAILKKGYKLVYNMSAGSIEELSYMSKPLDPEGHRSVVDNLLSELLLKSSQESGTAATIPASALEKEEELVVLERLRALGYT